jgi:glutamine synthetase
MKSEKFFLEYIWLDGNNPQKLRSKTKIVTAKNEDKIKLSNWGFDGSSTNQAETSKSEMVLIPVNKFKDPFRNNGFLVMCEVYNTDGAPHSSNKRSQLVETLKSSDEVTMYGFEQEYIIYDRETNQPLGWPREGYPRPQGDYYCGVGGDNVSGRDFVNQHAELCIEAGLSFTGINAEVMLGQWEYQIGPVKALDGSDQLWISRWILERLSEQFNYYIEFHPKPFKGNDWNGSGMHVNFSTESMREDMDNKKDLVFEACERLGKAIDDHISVYGVDNDLRLTGANETCSIKEFKYGIGDRTASIRIPFSINDDDTPGYLEDRRPASNANPYEICDVMIRTICVSEEVEN